MNRYEKYLDMKEFFNAVLSGSDVLIKEYNRKKDIQNKIYFYTKFRDSLLKIIDFKAEEEINKNIIILRKEIEDLKAIKQNSIEEKYVPEDIEFLKQFSAYDLTLEEACLVGKRDEYYNFIRAISWKMGKTSKKLDKLIDEDIQKLNGDYTPRLLWSFYKKHKKGNKN